MKLLLIEDDELKRSRLIEFVQGLYPRVQVNEVRSLQSGLRAMLSEMPDVVLLDMNLPNYDVTPEESGGRIQQFAGREILRQMRRRGMKVPVIVVTAFDYFGEGKNRITLEELHSELRRNFSDNYLGYIYYHPTLEDWQHSLPRLIDAAMRPVGEGSAG